MSEQKTMKNKDTNRIVMTAMFVSLVMAATYIGFPTPDSVGGYIHFGTLVMLAIAIKYGKYYGAMAGGIGMALFDIFSPLGYAAWAPATLIIRLAMGFVVGVIANDPVKGQGGNIYRNIIAFVASMFIMLPGYFVFQAWLLSAGDGGGYDKAVLGIPGNLVQFVVGLVAFYLIRFLPEKRSLSI